MSRKNKILFEINCGLIAAMGFGLALEGWLLYEDQLLAKFLLVGFGGFVTITALLVGVLTAFE